MIACMVGYRNFPCSHTEPFQGWAWFGENVTNSGRRTAEREEVGFCHGQLRQISLMMSHRSQIVSAVFCLEPLYAVHSTQAVVRVLVIRRVRPQKVKARVLMIDWETTTWVAVDGAALS